MILEKYSSNWVNDFADIKREIKKGLDGLIFNIEHVGSMLYQI
jgi:GrpB-like predicted nucleotidyltransferase (UPF0157 family)